MTALLVALGAAVGAPLRYLVDRAVQSAHRTRLPLGTLTVNVAGSFLLGALVGVPVAPALGALLGTGFCGALTTWSTCGYETLRLARTGARSVALANIVLSVTVGLGAAWLGFALARALAG
ncbi:fluoride efflux transporter CrcB [Micromonospora yangpuensis]|uniref:fluoride efflux transporter CrcB n=1 Tax=Micromonospora yangpuensis TaxID=683228 RepID=UPI000B86745E|nr:fluoride efflux transporter CrcB [Micromonospora yangpuensis]